jgi:hypothetical protein
MGFDSSFWRKCRTGFRWCRFSALFAVLVLICAVAWLNRVGLPGFVKTQLVENLRSHGIELKFSRLRLHFVRGFVAENVLIGSAKNPDSPVLSLRQLQIQLDYLTLLRGRLQIAGLVLRQGKLVWPLGLTHALTLDHIQTDLRFQANDIWSLDHFQADFSGMELRLSGDMAHASEIRRWDILRGRQSANFAVWQARLRKFSDLLNQVHFDGMPQLTVNVNGDARDMHSCTVRADVIAPGVQAPWFNARNLQFAATVSAPADAPANFDSTWGFWTNAQPFRLTWDAGFMDLKAEKLNAAAFTAN